MIHLFLIVKVDILVTSLTKVFSGIGDVLAGCIVINPYNQSYHTIIPNIQSNQLCIPILSIEDSLILEYNSRNYYQRLLLINKNTLEIAKRLLNDNRIKSVYYPGLLLNESDYVYSNVLRKNKNNENENENENSCGYGCLLSFLLKDESKIQVSYFYEFSVCYSFN